MLLLGTHCYIVILRPEELDIRSLVGGAVPHKSAGTFVKDL